MSNDVKVTDREDGVEIHIQGDVKKDDVEQLTSSCRAGECSCSPEFISKISSIQTSGKDGDMKISLKTETLSVDDVMTCMNESDCGF